MTNKPVFQDMSINELTIHIRMMEREQIAYEYAKRNGHATKDISDTIAEARSILIEKHRQRESS